MYIGLIHFEVKEKYSASFTQNLVNRATKTCFEKAEGF